MNIYACLGPPLKLYKTLVEQYQNNHNDVLGALRGEEKQIVLAGDLSRMKALYTSEQLFTAAGSVYEFWTYDWENDKPEIEVYPDATWLTIMQSPKMHPGAVQEMDKMFHRMMSPEENTDNYVQMPVKWRGLEQRMIAQVFTARELPDLAEGQAVMRPEYLAIDPFMLLRLKPAHEDIHTSEAAFRAAATAPAERTPTKRDGTVVPFRSGRETK